MTGPRGLLATKLAVAALGLVAIALLAVSLRGVVLLDQAQELLLERPPQPARAEERARAAGRITPGQSAPLFVAGAAAAAGEPGRAIGLLRASLAAEPDNVAGWQLLARLLSETGQPDAAREALARARALSGDLPPAG